MKSRRQIKVKELNDDELDKIAAGIGNSDEDNGNKEKWAKVGIKLVKVNGFAEYYLIKDGTKISPQKALEIYKANGGEI